MGMFDDDLLSRLRRCGYSPKPRRLGPLLLSGEVNLWELPFPSLGLYLEPGSVTVGVRIGDLMNDPLLAVSLTASVPERVTELLHRVHAYEDEG